MGDQNTEAEVVEQRAEVDLLRRRVLNVVGHELRTPITTLRGLAELLGTEQAPAAEADLHEAIKRTARRVEALLDDLLVGTGVSTALPVGEAAPASVADTARAAWAELERGEGDLHIDGDATVVARPGVLARALSALLDNAARYGEPPVDVMVTSLDGFVDVVVADRGPGVPAAELPLVVEPFFRGERAVLTHHSLGLGLSVALAIAEQHEGDLRVRNRDGGGLEVELRLPSVTP